MNEQNTHHLNSKRYISTPIPLKLSRAVQHPAPRGANAQKQSKDSLQIRRGLVQANRTPERCGGQIPPQAHLVTSIPSLFPSVKPKVVQRSNSFEQCHQNMFPSNSKQFRAQSAEGESFGENPSKLKLTLNQGKYYTSQQKSAYLRKKFKKCVYAVIIILVYKSNLRYLLKSKYKRKSKFSHTPQMDKLKSEPQTKTGNSSSKMKMSTLSTILKSKSQFQKNRTISSMEDESEKEKEKDKSPPVSHPKSYLLRNSVQNRTMEEFVQKELQESQVKLPRIEQGGQQEGKAYGPSLAQYHKQFLKSHKEYLKLGDGGKKETRLKKSMSVQKSQRTTSSIATEKSEEEGGGKRKRNLKKMQTAVISQRMKTVESRKVEPRAKTSRAEEKKDVNRVQVFCRFSPFLEHIRTSSRVMVFKCSNSEYQNYYVMRKQ